MRNGRSLPLAQRIADPVVETHVVARYGRISASAVLVVKHSPLRRGFRAPVAGSGLRASVPQGIFLGIEAVFDVGSVRAVDGKSRTGFADEHACPQLCAYARIFEHDEAVVVDPAAVALPVERCPHSLGLAQQRDDLIAQVGAQVICDSDAGGARCLFPCGLSESGAVSLERGLYLDEPAQRALPDDLPESQEISVPSSVLVCDEYEVFPVGYLD